MNHPTDKLTPTQRELLAFARESLARYLAGEAVAMPEPLSENPRLLEPAAVFVTLRRLPETPGETGELRGCIGQIEADMPLIEAISDAAIKAATIDPRFPPVTADELNQLTIEISVLSPMRPISHLDEILIGQDGLYIEHNRRRGLLLPEVAAMYAWDAAEFVRRLCHKAGLPENTWPDDGRLYAFTTESFEDSPADLSD